LLAFAGLALISTFILPEPELINYAKAWMFNLISDQQIGVYAQRILINLLNAENPEFIKPHWVPSKKEIKDLLKDNKINLEVKFQIGGALTSKTFTLPHICKVNQLMEQIYNLPQIAQLIDKYTFWIYVSSETVKATEDKALYQEAM